MIQQVFSNVSSKEKVKAIENLFEHSAPSMDFFMMIVLSVLMATFGLLMDNSAVIVGSMLIAPILYPILALAVGITMADFSLVSKSSITLLKATIIGIAVSAVVTLLFMSQSGEYTKQIIERTTPSLLSAAVGVVAGLAAAFAMVKPRLNETLPGIAISVALIPPLAVVGIGLASFNFEILSNALLLFIINALGVVFSASIVFSFMNLYSKKREAEKTVKEEEKKIEKEKEIGQKTLQ